MIKPRIAILVAVLALAVLLYAMVRPDKKQSPANASAAPVEEVQVAQTSASNRPEPKVAKTFVLFGLKGGDSEKSVEDILKSRGYPDILKSGGHLSFKCIYGNVSRANDCTIYSDTYLLRIEFADDRLEGFTFYFPASEWKRQVLSFEETLGEPTETDDKADSQRVSWDSEMTTKCSFPINGIYGQCPLEFLVLEHQDQKDRANASYVYNAPNNSTDGAGVPSYIKAALQSRPQNTERIDLNGDGVPEVTESEHPCRNPRGCPWSLLDGRSQKRLMGPQLGQLYVMAQSTHGYRDLLVGHFRSGADLLKFTGAKYEKAECYHYKSPGILERCSCL